MTQEDTQKKGYDGPTTSTDPLRYRNEVGLVGRTLVSPLVLPPSEQGSLGRRGFPSDEESFVS